MIAHWASSHFTKEQNTSRMQLAVDSVDSWSSLNHMNINIKKTKKCSAQSPSLLLQLNGQPIERVIATGCWFHVTETSRWNEHVSILCFKAAQRLHFLQQCHQKIYCLAEWVPWSTNGIIFHKRAEPVVCTIYPASQAQQWRHLQASRRQAISRNMDSNWTLQQIKNYMWS